MNLLDLIALVIGWAIMAVTVVAGIFFVADFIARALLGFIMAGQWKREDQHAEDDDVWKQR